jgi:hypothetical protein
MRRLQICSMPGGKLDPYETRQSSVGRGSQRQDVSGRKETLHSILALHPETALLTFCAGTLERFTPCTH